MKVLLRKTKIVYPGHALHGKTLDILIDKGKILEIGKSISPQGKVHEIESKSLHASPGWLDFRANFCEPGYEDAENLLSGRKAAAAGGFTGVCVSGSTTPVTDSRAGIEFFTNKNGTNPVDLYPIGALSQKMEGVELSEMYDMKQAGAVAFSDYKSGIQNAKFMQLAIEYAKGIGSTLLSFAMNNDLKGKAQVNEGENSTKLGLKGIPHLAEEMNVNRDLFLAKYCDGKIHFTGLSSTTSVDMIAKSKKAGSDVSCDVSVAQLILNDACLNEFDSNYKLMPPIRTEKDRKALINQVLNGSIDVICSDHTPHTIENKACEFELASYGMTSIQLVYSLINSKLNGKIDAETLIEKIAINPRKILGIEIPAFEVNSDANLTFFDPTLEWTYSKGNNLSKSNNTPFLGETFTGKVIGVVNNGQVVLND